MTGRQADKIIKAGKPVTVHNAIYNETFTTLFTERDRYNIYSVNGHIYDRVELQIVSTTK